MKTKILKLILVLVCFSVSAYTSYDYLLHEVPVYLKSKNLVEARTQKTRFLVPKQWQRIDVKNGKTEGYGDKLGKDNKSISGIGVTQDSERLVLPAAPDEAYELVRKMAYDSKELREDAKRFFTIKGLENCQATVDIKDDTLEQNGLVGIVRITSSCGSRPENTKMVTRLAVGREDGCLRYISVFSYNEYWKQNSKVFEEILNSASYIDTQSA